jgi:hypothetical protein
MNTRRFWPQLLGALAGVLVTVAASYSFTIWLCLNNGGTVVGFGMSCETPVCDAYPLTVYLLPTMVLLAAVFFGLPAFLIAREILKRWFKCLVKMTPNHSLVPTPETTLHVS